MRRAFVVAAFTALLAACGPPSVEDFIEDPELLGDAIQECRIEVAQGKPASEECRNAREAAGRMAGNIVKDAMRSVKDFAEGLRE